MVSPVGPCLTLLPGAGSYLQSVPLTAATAGRGAHSYLIHQRPEIPVFQDLPEAGPLNASTEPADLLAEKRPAIVGTLKPSESF